MKVTTSERPILICFDGSAEAVRAVSVAGELFNGRRAILLYVSSAAGVRRLHTTSTRQVRRELIEEVQRAARRDARAVADQGVRVASTAGLIASPRVLEESGGLAETVVRAAAQASAAAILVAGSHRGGQLRERHLAHRLIDASTVPVVVV
jgi:nucleotide-binding universal stress UspA family protein